MDGKFYCIPKIICYACQNQVAMNGTPDEDGSVNFMCLTDGCVQKDKLFGGTLVIFETPEVEQRHD